MQRGRIAMSDSSFQALKKNIQDRLMRLGALQGWLLDYEYEGETIEEILGSIRIDMNVAMMACFLSDNHEEFLRWEVARFWVDTAFKMGHTGEGELVDAALSLCSSQHERLALLALHPGAADVWTNHGEGWQ
jgi:hypothetical protein